MATQMLPSPVGLENLTADDQTGQLILERLQEMAAPIFSSANARPYPSNQRRKSGLHVQQVVDELLRLRAQVP